MTVSPVIPALRYRDARGAIRFLTEGLGFRVSACYPEEGEQVDHAELVRGGGMVMLGSGREGGVELAYGGSAVYLVLDEDAQVDAVHEAALRAGAESVVPPHDEDFGGRGAVVRDAEGNLWSFGSYRPQG